MKKIIWSVLLAAGLLASCSTDENEETTTDYSKSPVSGKIYERIFNVGGGAARSVTLNGTKSFYIYLTPDSIDCDGTFGSPIWITVPAKVGEYTNNSSLQFRDNVSESFEGAIDKKIEILSISKTKIKGRLKATGFYSFENNINGTFEVQYCPL